MAPPSGKRQLRWSVGSWIAGPKKPTRKNPTESASPFCFANEQQNSPTAKPADAAQPVNLGPSRSSITPHGRFDMY